jgi:hypothetical protein
MATIAFAWYDLAVSDGPHVATVIRERSSEILASWIVRFERSPLRFRRTTKAATYTAQVANLVELLGVAASASQLQPGSDATRELERSAAFLGGQFASEGATGYDLAALLLELRDVLAGMVTADANGPLTRLFEWLTVVALDGFAASGMQALREKVSEQLELGTPIVELMPKVPAVFLVASPSSSLIDDILARAWMLAIGTAAPCLILDAGGLADGAERAFDSGFAGFLRQAEGSAVQLLLSRARRALRERVEAATNAHGVAFQHFDRLDSAVVHALERAGHLLMRRG